MSFKCGNCKKAQPPGTKPIRKVVETRQVRYCNRYGKRSIGTEIVREEDRCAECP